MNPKTPIHKTINTSLRDPRLLGGAALIVAGAIVLLSQYLKTTWLPLVILPVAGLIVLGESLRSRRGGLMVAGSLLSGISIGSLLAISPIAHSSAAVKAGTFLAAFAASWLMIALLGHFVWSRNNWWALVPAGALGGLAGVFLFTGLTLVDFILYVCIGVGLALLFWGIIRLLPGLIIPGSLLAGIGPGIYAAWAPWEKPNPLAQTGLMLVWFALGWVMITLVIRFQFARLVWWPLIPAGVLAMVGTGLYIGGNPGNALSLVSNTGSVALIVFGLYLILLRRGIQR
jgi:hypothetical protein